MIIQIQPDRQKAKSLHQMAMITLERLNETDKDKYPSNTLTDYYDIIRKLMESLNFLDGVKIKGEGAHLQIINHICEKYKFGDSTKHFIQEMRNFLNRISYEGFSVKESYIKTNAERIEKIIAQLKKLIDEKL